MGDNVVATYVQKLHSFPALIEHDRAEFVTGRQ
jgi:hypothetical protein